MKFNQRIIDIEVSPIVDISEEIRDLIGKGRKIVQFQRGEMNFNTPAPIREAAKAAIEEPRFTKYPKSGGEQALRKAIAAKLAHFNNAKGITADNVVVTAGGQEALFISFMLMSHRKGIVMSPCWSCALESFVPYSGVQVSHFILKEPDFAIDFDTLDRQLQEAAFIYINDPHNPTGKVFTKEEKAEILRLCEKHDVLIIADEPYERFVYDGRFTSFLAFGSRNVLGAFSFSKTYAMTGWRLGYLASANQVICNRAKTMAMNTQIPATGAELPTQVKVGLATRANYAHTAGVPPFIQQAGIAALTSEEVDREVESNREELRNRRDALYDILKSIDGVSLQKPGGAFYLFPSFTALIPDECQGRERELFIYKKLLAAGIGTVYGSCFGDMHADNIRFSFSAVTLEEIAKAGELIRSVFA